MATLKERLHQDLTSAMKARDELATSTLRMALAAITNAEVAGDEAVELSDEQVVGVLVAEAKKRSEAAEVYESAGRDAQGAKERAELALITTYLPAALGDEELSAIVADEVARAAAQGVTGPKAMGQVVKAVRSRAGAGADGARIAVLVKSALG
ncbi:MAG: GatB/YqeY domain-containing protein [Actinomycetota bacterium]|nr:MAG: GatB/YqeY domain-containing protein [Actinomycetota bacterium]